MDNPDSENVEAIFGQCPSLVKADYIQFPTNVHPIEISILFELLAFVCACLWGLMQKMSFFFSLERAKLVPIDNVAGNAGGTTMVIRSNARTRIKCHASYSRSASNTEYVDFRLYLKPNEIDEGSYEAHTRNSSHDGYISKGVFVKFETRGLRE